LKYENKGLVLERMTIKAYAVKHKLSIFNVMKMVKAGKVKSEVFQEKGREVTYILFDEETEKEIRAQIVPMEEKEDLLLREEIKFLKKEVRLLKEDIEELKKRL
jgi:pullulanase/glycogen debranching enzyme